MKNLEQALEKYSEHFGTNYPLCISGNRTNEEIIEDIELCIDTDTEAEQPSYEDDADY